MTSVDYSNPIHQISDKLHFNDPTTFCRFFRRETGITPKEYREGNIETLLAA